jgi:hypothetical protein
VAALKENCDQQARHIQHQARALDEMRREGQQDVAMAYRLNYGAERRAATMQARLGLAAADQERAFAAAASQLEAMRRERDTLAEALAAVAEAAVGGQEATAAELASEARAAEDEGADPLPRRPDAWVKFNYYVPPAHARRLASQVGLDAAPAFCSALKGKRSVWRTIGRYRTIPQLMNMRQWRNVLEQLRWMKMSWCVCVCVCVVVVVGLVTAR